MLAMSVRNSCSISFSSLTSRTPMYASTMIASRKLSTRRNMIMRYSTMNACRSVSVAQSSRNSPRNMRNSVCIVFSKVPNSSRSLPNRHVPMPAKDPMMRMMRRAECQKSSIAFEIVPVRSARRGCSDVHWMTRMRSTINTTLRNASTLSSVPIRARRSCTLAKKVVFLSVTDTSLEAQGMASRLCKISRTAPAEAILEGRRRHTTTVVITIVSTSTPIRPAVKRSGTMRSSRYAPHMAVPCWKTSTIMKTMKMSTMHCTSR
mmetsp:Transcript_10884/g.25513  ORF Transcript_10884/g.25513 Transcript_10884/m.25513 type:complete len:262 (-) Transcript_10884:4030-4815(-)